jgi:hypothetical protein
MEDNSRDLDLGRMRVLDAKPVNLDGFSVTNPELGLVAMRSPYDPEPSLVVRDGVVVELDATPRRSRSTAPSRSLSTATTHHSPKRS